MPTGSSLFPSHESFPYAGPATLNASRRRITLASSKLRATQALKTCASRVSEQARRGKSPYRHHKAPLTVHSYPRHLPLTPIVARSNASICQLTLHTRAWGNRVSHVQQTVQSDRRNMPEHLLESWTLLSKTTGEPPDFETRQDHHAHLFTTPPLSQSAHCPQFSGPRHSKRAQLGDSRA